VRRIAQAASLAALAATITPPVLYFFDRMELDVATAWMLGATVVWFAATPFWMGRE
jgi:hypothetical protein